MKAVPAELADVDAELAAAVAYPFAQHEVFAELAVGAAEAVLLLAEDVDLALQALLDAQVGMLEVVAQHRLDQRRGMRAQAEQAR